MTITRLPVYYPSQEEKYNPKLYVENVRGLMPGKFSPFQLDLGVSLLFF
ncbi:putative plasmalogen synthase [Helianthus annuus]|nr:putative plasmalogen synthase [Helianthus annuus]